MHFHHLGRGLACGLTLAALLSLVTVVSAQPAEPAHVRVLLPAGGENAVVSFDGKATQQKGLERLYYTPPLPVGEKKSYEVTAAWTAGGKEVKQSRKAFVSGGQLTVVDFTKAEDTAKDNPKTDGPKTNSESRTFLFTYAATVSKLPAGKTARVWLPVPQTTPDQDVTIDKESLPGKSSVATEPLYGNKILYFEAMPDMEGNLAFSVTYKVTRREVRTGGGSFRKPGDRENLDRFLEADKLVPVNGKPLELVKGVTIDKDQLKAGKSFYDVVNRHMKYSKEGKGWGNGDAVWACDSKFGNCSDFHSLFISLARSQKIPAKFEMGFPIPDKHGEGTVGGYHCWAWFLPDGKGWVPVDISEANRNPELRDYYFGNLTPSRVQFTTGRDIDLVPRQAGPPLNFFIYPYLEVEGRALPREQIQAKFSYRDVE
jgi:uncharacterized protein (TIGR03000 family)